jgi:sodium/bile acid cotransporter 3/5
MFNISGKFLGFDTVQAKVVKNSKEIMASRDLSVAVVRRKTIQSKLFSYSVAVLISLAYINLGCALDLQVVKKTLKRPIGPAIGFICQFLIMPLLSYGLGFVFGSKATAMRLGLFVTGTSPGGGASNIWTVMFGGNLDLSVTMTAVSTFAAFFMMPLWIFTLGATIFDETNIVIPYYKICIYAFFLVVPLSIGLAISRYVKRERKRESESARNS